MLGIDPLLDFPVFFFELLGRLYHFLDLRLGQSAHVVGDGDGLGFTDSFLYTSDSKDAVFVDFKGDFDLGYTAGGRWDATEVELAELVVVLAHGTLTLED